MRITARVVATLVCVLVLIGLAVGPVSQSVAAPGKHLAVPQDDNISSQSALQLARASRPWTAQEMANAKPYPLPDPGKLEAALVSLSAKDFENLTPEMFPGGMPEGEKNGLSIPGMNLAAFGAPSGYTYPAPFTRFTTVKAYEKEWPQKTIGKLFFYQNGIAYVCSAASIGNYAIWTAGHCVHDGSGYASGWSYNVTFSPGYPSRPKKLGTYTASYLVTKSGWYYNQDAAYDMGGAVLYPYKKKSVSDRVGYLGFAYNLPVQQHWFSIGYPSAAPFDGAWQVTCASSYAYSDSAYTPNPVGVGCDQTNGTSGGPWILAYGSGYYLNGNMSYRYTAHPLELFSPYFGDAAYSLWSTLINGVP